MNAAPADPPGRHEPERDWIERIRAGDTTAFEALFHAYYRELAAFAFRYVRSRDMAEEIVHDVLVRLWERRQSFVLRDKLRTYLYTAVRNEALNQIRHSLVERRWADRVVRDRKIEPAPGNANAGQAQLEREELTAAVERVLAQVPGRCRTALMLRWQQQMSYAEVAQAMGVSIKTVEAYISRALAALRDAHATLGPHR